ncbi:anti-sigma-K factor RskA [Marmoricola sp. OAE513]|uniref:anti-sigma factor n=1 Tax=Marmoricola sp. OAE513 TaxID=2817894 RepID=UPI001AE208A5
MTAHEIHALSGAYAVDALDDLERARFEAHLAECAECQAEVASLQATATLFSDLTEVAPPKSVRDQLMTEIKTVRPLPPTVARIEAKIQARRPRRWSSFVAAAAVLGVLGGGVAVWQDQRNDVEAPQYANAEVDRVLKAEDVQHFSAQLPGGASVTVSVSDSARHAVIVTRKMPAAPDDRVYQLWFQRGDTMVSAGLMKGDTTVLKGDPSGASGVGVTVEQRGGSPTGEPTTAPVALVDFEQA